MASHFLASCAAPGVDPSEADWLTARDNSLNVVGRFKSLIVSIFAELAKIEELARRAGDRAEGVEGRFEDVSGQNTILLRNNIVIMAALERLIGEGRAERARLQEQFATPALRPVLSPAPRPAPVFGEPGSPAPLDPELVLLGWLKPELSGAAAIDVGAHRGEYSEHLLRLGFEVFALEPHPDSFACLEARLAGEDRFKAFNLAAGAADGKAELLLPTDHSVAGYYKDATLYASLAAHSMPDGLVVENRVEVQVRDLSGMARDGLIPSDAAILKIDVEGWEAEVLDGAKALSPEVVVAEFWSTDSAFGGAGALNNPRAIYTQLAARGYRHLLTFSRVHGSTEVTFLVNQPDGLANSWGNLMLFKDARLFSSALGWAEASLRRTYPGAPAPQGNN